MSDFSIFESDQKQDVLVYVPSKSEVAWVFIAAILVSAIGIMTGFEAIRWLAEPVGSLVMASISAISLFCAIWFPIQAVRQRHVAIEVNAWEPPALK